MTAEELFMDTLKESMARYEFEIRSAAVKRGLKIKKLQKAETETLVEQKKVV